MSGRGEIDIRQLEDRLSSIQDARMLLKPNE